MNLHRICGDDTALLLIDIQYDFLPPSGALAVPSGQDILPAVYRLLDPSLKLAAVVASRDYHPPDHISFASTHNRINHGEGDRFKPFTEIEIEPFPAKLQLWPDHCIQGTKGCELESGVKQRLDKLLELGREVFIVNKGTETTKEAYSAFRDDQDHELNDYLKARQVSNLVCVGLATDYCVKATVKSALRLGYRVFLVSSGTAAVGGLAAQQKVEQSFLEEYAHDLFQITDVESVVEWLGPDP